MSFFGFHPLIERWFHSRFERPTQPQEEGWPPILREENTLIAAPTGSGKTLTAFLACIDRLLKESLRKGLPDEVRVVYVSPLRALSNDMHRNLEVPLEEINALAAEEASLHFSPLRAGLRTGDTSSSRRAALVRKPPHILVTTPESLYLMLTAPKARETLRKTQTVIVDEIHALVRDKRGSHLALSLERLAALSEHPLQRIGLSATQKPIGQMAAFLVGGFAGEDCGEEFNAGEFNAGKTAPVTTGASAGNCTLVDTGHQRELDLAIETPASPLGAVCTHEQWAEVNEKLVQLIQAHRSTLIFVNTRRLAERLSHQLTDILGEEAVSSHHGSLSAPLRLQTEQRLKTGRLKAVVATASLELGIDIGYIDLVVQMGSPRSIATFLQRIGRSGHSLGLTPKGRLFALTRDELLESMALLRAVKAGRLDAVRIPEAPLDVLAQQMVAEVSAREWGTDDLFALFRRAYPYRHLRRDDFDRVVEYLSEGIARNGGRSRVYLHHDQVGRRLRARKGARIPATSNAGAIPEIFQFRVVAEPERTVVGSLDEDFAVESMAGDVFLLGNTSWRILNVRGGDVNVVDAHGAPPTIPFWRGEAPGRTWELSAEVSRLRAELDRRLVATAGSGREERQRGEEETDREKEAPDRSSRPSSLSSATSADGIEQPEIASADFSSVTKWLAAETNASEADAQQAVHYAAAQKAAVGLLPTQRRIVFERFFDESGGMQLVVHAPFGGAVNRAWGLAMRKRFCRSFDFELQATADDNGFILSLGPQHSFPIESLFGMLTPANARQMLEQAVLAVPMFELRWRWNVTRSLLVLRQQNGKKVPPALQRFRAQDLLTAVFPRLTGCQEEHTGDIPIPDHPLVQQTLDDCLTEAVDLNGLLQVLDDIQRGDITLLARDTREPSPFSCELLNANPYAFLDGGEIQERRTRAVSTRRSLSVESADDLGRLDPEAIARVVAEAHPPLRSADELHDCLLRRIILPVEEISPEDLPAVQSLFAELAENRRAAEVRLPDDRRAWVAAERWPAARAAFPELQCRPELAVPPTVRQEWSGLEARVALVRGLLEICGPITAGAVARRLSLREPQTAALLEALEGEGLVLRGRFSPALTAQQSREWKAEGTQEPPSAGTDSCGDPVTDTSASSPASLTSRSASPASHPSSLGSPTSREWCHRGLLARIHRLTLQGLRRQIEPVSPDVFQRFLFRHHGLLPGFRRAGVNGVYEVVAMLQGIDLPAICWERDVLPLRIENYQPQWLDELCLAGEVGWGRLQPAQRDPQRSRPMSSLTRVAPLSLFLRDDAGWLIPPGNDVDTSGLSSPGREVFDLLRRRGALFAADLLRETRMLPAQLDEVLGELITRGVVTADGFGGLRRLIAEKGETARRASRRRRVRQRNTAGTAGRWSVWRPGTFPNEQTPRCDSSGGRNGRNDNDVQPLAERNTPSAVEEWAWQLLRRWGVVFRDLLQREPSAPRWYELLPLFRKLEARGEIRGGRFLHGVSGEQFALGETVRQLRQLRDESAVNSPADSGPLTEILILSAADPLHLTGLLSEQPRIPRIAPNRVAYGNGEPVAAILGEEVRFFRSLPAEQTAEITRRLKAPSLSDAADFRADASFPSASGRPSRGLDSREGKPASSSPAGSAARRSRRRTPEPRYPNDIPRPLF